MILKYISQTDKIGHLFIINIKFHVKNEKTLLFNEIYMPRFENSKLRKHTKTSTFECFIEKQEKRYHKYGQTQCENPFDYERIKIYSSLWRTFAFSSDQGRLACNQNL